MPDSKTDALDELTAVAPSGGLIFHYTSQQGLLGIIKDKALWLSSIRHLSDAKEFGYAVELARSKLNHRLQAERGPWNGYYGKVLERLDAIDAIQDLVLFVGSFSETADLLSQWRAYAPSGGGFSIGFEHEYLKTMANKQGLRIMKCIYDLREHEAILENLINRAGTLVKNGECEQAVAGFFVGLLRVAPALKDASFYEEREWRVVSDVLNPSDAKPKFRVGKSMLIPYQEFKLAAGGQKMSVSRIIVGPTPHMSLSISSLAYLLSTSTNVDQTYSIEHSRVPYRSW